MSTLWPMRYTSGPQLHDMPSNSWSDWIRYSDSSVMNSKIPLHLTWLCHIELVNQPVSYQQGTIKPICEPIQRYHRVKLECHLYVKISHSLICKSIRIAIVGLFEAQNLPNKLDTRYINYNKPLLNTTCHF